MKKLLFAAAALALAAVPASATNPMLTSTESHAYECVVQTQDEPGPMLQGGRAHVTVDGNAQTVTVALRDLLARSTSCGMPPRTARRAGSWSR
jgi:hypothetical protein